MVAFLLVLAIVAFFAIDIVFHLRRKPSLADQLRARVEESEATLARRVAGFRVAPDTAYHPGHTWARRHARGVARVGVDDFAARLVGRPDRIEVPPVGATVRAGRPFATLHRRGRRIGIVAPISGAVAAVNSEALHSAGSVVDDPYGAGWLVDIRSTDLAFDFRALLSGELARRFMDEAAGALHSFFSPEVAAAADGGRAIEGIGDSMDEATWDRVRCRFLLTDPE